MVSHLKLNGKLWFTLSIIETLKLVRVESRKGHMVYEARIIISELAQCLHVLTKALSWLSQKNGRIIPACSRDPLCVILMHRNDPGMILGGKAGVEMA